MKINFSKSIKKNKPLHIHSVYYPGAGYVAIPENKPSGFKRKHNKKIKSLKQELVSIVDTIKRTI